MINDYGLERVSLIIGVYYSYESCLIVVNNRENNKLEVYGKDAMKSLVSEKCQIFLIIRYSIL